MLAIEASLLCDYAIEDKETRKHTIVGIFDRITARTFPAIHPNLFLFTAVYGAAGTHTIRFQVIAPDGHIVLDSQASIAQMQIPGEGAGRHFAITQVSGLSLPQPGTYYVQYIVDNETYSQQYAFVVHQVQEKSASA